MVSVELTGPGENFNMQIHVQAPTSSLIADPFHTERFGSFMAAVKATLLHPRIMERI